VIVSTVNVNGIRDAAKQQSSENLRLLPWLTRTRADAVCLRRRGPTTTNAPACSARRCSTVPLARWGYAQVSGVGGRGHQGPQWCCGACGGHGGGGHSTNDAGWRIDYQLATHGLGARADAPRVERASA